jgi:hypothetical protein
MFKILIFCFFWVLSIAKPLTVSECEFTVSIMDQIDDASAVECYWRNVPDLNNFYYNLINNNKKTINYIYGDSIDKIFVQYSNDRTDDCFRIEMLNKRLMRYLNRIYNTKC